MIPVALNLHGEFIKDISTRNRHWVRLATSSWPGWARFRLLVFPLLGCEPFRHMLGVLWWLMLALASLDYLPKG